MKISRNFFTLRGNRSSSAAASESRRDEQGRIHVPLYSDFFRNDRNLIYTNAQYASFRDEVIASIDIYPPREKILLSVYSSSLPEETDKDMILIGFARYLNLCYQGQRREVLSQLRVVTLFLALGILIEFFTFGICPPFADWILSCLDIIGCVFIWQFIGYFAFEFAGQRRNLQRLLQVQQLEYEFRSWD